MKMNRKSAWLGVVLWLAAFAPVMSAPAQQNPSPETNDAVRRMAAVKKAAETPGSAACFDALSHAARREKNAIIRREAVIALGRSSRLEAVAIIEEALNDPDPTVVAEAAKGLGQHKRASSGPALLGLLKICRDRKDGYGPVIQEAVIKALGECGDVGAVPAIMERLERHEDINFDNTAVRALGAIGTTNALPCLREHLAYLEAREPTEPMARYSWEEAVRIAREAVAAITGQAGM